MSQRKTEGRPTVKIRLDALGRGSISIDDGPELPVRHLKITSGVKEATVVSFDLIAVNIDAELPVDQVEPWGTRTIDEAELMEVSLTENPPHPDWKVQP